MARKRKVQEHHEEHMDESWLVPYADILTLLLALFIVLFASSSLDQAKYNAVMDAISEAFSGDTVIEETGTGQSGGENLPYPEAGLPGDISELLESIPPAVSEAPTDNTGGEQLGNLFTSILNYIDTNGLQEDVSVEYQGDDVLVTLRNDINYASANADVSPEMQEKARVLAQMLAENQDPEHPLNVVVAGHTDNIPIDSAQYPSNWDLSMDRSKNFLRVLLENPNLDPTLFSTQGFGEYKPIASNDTAEGRQKNRRVELLISQKMHQDQVNGTTGTDG